MRVIKMKEKTAKTEKKTVDKKPGKQVNHVNKKLPESKQNPAGKPLAGPLDECTKAHVSETYRLEDEDDACNDSVQ